MSRKQERSNRKLRVERLSVNGRQKWAFFLGKGMVGWIRDDVHRQEANYLQVVHVDYHDYD